VVERSCCLGMLIFYHHLLLYGLFILLTSFFYIIGFWLLPLFICGYSFLCSMCSSLVYSPFLSVLTTHPKMYTKCIIQFSACLFLSISPHLRLDVICHYAFYLPCIQISDVFTLLFILVTTVCPTVPLLAAFRFLPSLPSFS